jgi:hypothetical protein
MQSRLVTTESPRSVPTTESPRGISRVTSITPPPAITTNSPAPAINTILAVREHAPAEIDELNALIQNLHHRLGVAYARKHLLEQLLTVIHESDGNRAPGMSIVR